MALKQLGGSDFSKIKEVIPGLEALLIPAPYGGGLAEPIGGLTSKIGDSIEKMGV